MNTMIDSPMPELATRTVNQDETHPPARHREPLTSWSIVMASTILALLVCKIVMLELEVHNLLDELLGMAGQAPLSKS